MDSQNCPWNESGQSQFISLIFTIVQIPLLTQGDGRHGATDIIKNELKQLNCYAFTFVPFDLACSKLLWPY